MEHTEIALAEANRERKRVRDVLNDLKQQLTSGEAGDVVLRDFNKFHAQHEFMKNECKKLKEKLSKKY